MALSKEKTASLVKYQVQLKDKLASTTPAKHVHRDASYRQYLERELSAVTATIEAAKMEGTNK